MPERPPAPESESGVRSLPQEACERLHLTDSNTGGVRNLPERLGRDPVEHDISDPQLRGQSVLTADRIRLRVRRDFDWLPAGPIRESVSLPLSQKRGVGLLLAIREWEPMGFRRLRRVPQH